MKVNYKFIKNNLNSKESDNLYVRLLYNGTSYKMKNQEEERSENGEPPPPDSGTSSSSTMK